MKSRDLKQSLLLALALIAAPLAAQAPVAELPNWMAGTWMAEDGNTWADEVWTDPRGGVMLGIGRAGFGPELREWEALRIERGEDGRLTLIAKPSKGSETRFPMVLVSEEAIEFANPAHGYPQRIRYSRQGKLLIAEISKLDGSEAMRWNYRPVVPPQD